MNPVTKGTKAKTTVNDLTKKLMTVLHKIQEADQNIKADVEALKIEQANEIVIDNKNKCLLIQVSETSIANLHKIHSELVRRLEDQLSTQVIIVPSRKTTNGNIYRRYRGSKAPRDKTLTANYAAALEDVLYPATVVGLRTRFSRGGSRLFKVLVDPLDKDTVGYKSLAVAASYKQLTNRNLVVEFPQA
jgi:small subunit ribosomal protein S7e